MIRFSCVFHKEIVHYLDSCPNYSVAILVSILAVLLWGRNECQISTK